MRNFESNDNTPDDSASIYQQREVKTEKQKLSEMTFKEKLIYFNNYYRTKTIIAIAILALAIGTIHAFVTPRPKTLLYAAILNSAIDDQTAQKLQNSFAKHINIKPKREKIYLDTSYYIGGVNDTSQYSVACQQKLTTYLVTSQIDVLITSKKDFARFAHNGSMAKLTDQLPTDLCKSLANSFYYSDTEDDSTSSAYGISLDHATIYDKTGKKIEKPILGIAVNTKNNQTVVEFVRYLFHLYQ